MLQSQMSNHHMTQRFVESDLNYCVAILHLAFFLNSLLPSHFPSLFSLHSFPCLSLSHFLVPLTSPFLLYKGLLHHHQTG